MLRHDVADEIRRCRRCFSVFQAHKIRTKINKEKINCPKVSCAERSRKIPIRSLEILCGSRKIPGRFPKILTFAREILTRSRQFWTLPVKS
jgi:hypothetical protein